MGKNIISHALASKTDLNIINIDGLDLDSETGDNNDIRDHLLYLRTKKILEDVTKSSIINFGGDSIPINYFDKLYPILAKFHNIIYLKYPSDLSNNPRADDMYNSAKEYIDSGIFDKISYVSVVMDVFDSTGYDKDIVDSIADDIIDICKVDSPDYEIVPNRHKERDYE